MASIKDEQHLLNALKNGQESALDELFRSYYAYLCRAVFKVLPDKHIAEDIVQEVFYELWRKRDQLQIKQSVSAYLRRAAINKTLNYIRAKKVPVDDETYLPIHLTNKTASAQQKLQADELKELINEAIGLLPERCRLIFTLSRHEEMSNKEIAANLNLSIKTIENQMTKALRLLKEALAPYLLSWISILWVTLCFM